jgi:hypothetical protein
MLVVAAGVVVLLLSWLRCLLGWVLCLMLLVG